MAEEEELEEEFQEDLGDEGEEEKPGKGKLISVLVVSALLGVGGGAFVLPGFLGGSYAEAESSHSEEETGGGGHGIGPVGRVFSLTNIVVNARGSGGNRLLVATIAIEVADGSHLEELQEREFQLRDEVTTILESIPMGVLVRLGARDTVKQRVREMLHRYVGDDARLRVYVPQFVLQ